MAVAAPAARPPTTTTSWEDRGIMSGPFSGSAGSRAGGAHRRAAAGEVAGDEGGVVAHAVDEVGVAAVLEPLPHHVQAFDRRDAPALDDLAVPAQHRHLQPRVLAAVTGGPHDGGQLLGPPI